MIFKAMALPSRRETLISNWPVQRRMSQDATGKLRSRPVGAQPFQIHTGNHPVAIFVPETI